MRNFRKLLAVLVAVAITLTAMAPVFAAEVAPALSADAQITKDLGMIIGEGSGVTPAYMSTEPSRMQAAIMFLRLKGLEETAKAYTGTANFADGNIVWTEGRNILAYLKANPDLGWVGDGTNFMPNQKINAQQYYKVVLESLGYKQGVDFQFADTVTFAAGKGLSKAAAGAFTVDSIAVATVEALKTTLKDGSKTLVAQLVAAGKIDGTKAEAAGIYTAGPAAASSLDIKSLMPLGPKFVEISLNTGIQAVDKNAVSISDSAGKAVEVANVALAGYDAKGKTVLVTLGSSLASGALYTLKSGDASFTFGGKSADSVKPTADTLVSATDFDAVKITFSEPVDISGANVTINEKTGAKAALAVNGYEYGANNSTLIVKTNVQTYPTFYSMVISGVKDFSGNIMDTDNNKVFTGKGKDTAKLAVSSSVNGATAIDYNKVVVKFDKNVDPATIAGATWTIEDKYKTPTVTVAVAGSAAATLDELDQAQSNGLYAPATDTTGQFVTVTLSGTMEANRTYNLTVLGSLQSKSGTVLNTAANVTTFIGMAKYTGSFTFDGDITTISNDTIKVKFARKLDAASAQLASNYNIVKTADGTSLSITKAVLDTTSGTGDMYKVVTLTTAAQEQRTYKLTVTGVKDNLGNGIDTSNNTKNFFGKQVQTKITTATVTSPTLADPTTMTLTFDATIASAATDVSKYTIDNGIGYPSKAELVASNAYQLKLTIPKTVNNAPYRIYIRNLANADGVAMDAAGINAAFIGAGLASKPSITGAYAMDSQTLKVVFDRPVTDASISDAAGKIWDGRASVGTNLLVAGALSIYDKDNTSTPKDIRTYGTGYDTFTDAADVNALIIRVYGATPFVASQMAPAFNGFELEGAAAKFDTSENLYVFNVNDTAATQIVIENAVAINSNTVRVYYNQPVYGSLVSSIKLGTSASTIGVTVPSAYGYADQTKKVVDYKFTTALTAGTRYYLMADTTTSALAGNASAVIHDARTTGKTFSIGVKDEQPGVTNALQVRPFDGVSTTVPDITADGIAAYMTDKKTMIVEFPEAMYTSGTSMIVHANTFSNDAMDPDNYNLYTDSALTLDVAMTGNGAAGAFSDAVTDIQTTDNRVFTLTLNDSIASSVTASPLYLKLGNATMQNASQTSTVKLGATGAVSVALTQSPAAALKLAVANVTYDGSTQTVTVKLNEKIKVAAAGTAEQRIADNFDIKVQLTDDSYYTLTSADITAVSGITAGGTTDWFSFTLSGALNIKTSGIGFAKAVAYKAAGPSAQAYGLNNEAYDSTITGDGVPFAQKDGIY